ncbi:glycosyltransferase family 87 protein [Chitinophagaceae bacterium 26-R-25]|nr:glycosyltransferase family 87 protein [Chitinophagaceae bacterium 26-R-25]
MNIIKSVKSGEILSNHRFATFLWFALSFIGVLPEVLKGRIHNYFVFKSVYLNLLEQHNLYIPFNDNLYGPLFGIIIAPFTYLPNAIGAILWAMINAWFLYFAINKLPISKSKKAFIIIVSSLEMMNVASYVQTNAAAAACIILGYCFIQEGKEWKAAFFILLATFVKIYGIVGLAFFFFSKKPFRFILWMIIWSVVFFVAPMLLSNPSFILQSYVDWKNTILRKNANNHESVFQNISLPGFLKRTLRMDIDNNLVVLAGMILFLTQYIRFKYFSDKRLQLYILCSTLIFVVIFSSSSETPTYIISFVGVCLWYVLQNKSRATNMVMIAAFVLTSLSQTDLFTPHFRDVFMRPYCIKAVGSIAVWFIIIYQIWKKQFLTIPPVSETDTVQVEKAVLG